MIIMSYNNYEKALELAKKCEGYLVGNGQPNDVIKKGQQLLGLDFSRQHYDYLNKLGFLDFFGHEFYGIPKGDFSGTPEGCMIECALVDRKAWNLPKEWVPVFNFDDGYMGYLDYGYLNEEGEPRVIMAIYTGQKYEIVEVIAEDFGDFLLQQVEEHLLTQ